MREHLAPTLYYLQVHLLYASIVCCAAWALTSIPRGSATVKYWIWVAASLNFVVPLGGFLDRFGAAPVSWATELHVLGDLGVSLSRDAVATALLAAGWAAGAALMLTRLLLRIRSEHLATRAPHARHALQSGPGLLARGIPVRFARTREAPAVDGVLRPQISLPEGIDRLLSEHELNAVLLHEVTHARRRDNLLRLLHELVVCVLWFHPLVWLTRARLALYRELSCDEPVIRSDRGEDLISALAKLADPAGEFVLRASAASFLSDRLDHLAADPQRRPSLALSSLLTVAFGVVLAAGVVETIAHTACCITIRP
jgi:beta-lactamase regulating signal transducer with metallopeptidase domain